MRAQQLAQRLTTDGIRCMGPITEYDQIEDGEIPITPKFHVSVGPSYNCLVRKNDDGRTMTWVKIAAHDDYHGLLQAIRNALTPSHKENR